MKRLALWLLLAAAFAMSLLAASGYAGSFGVSASLNEKAFTVLAVCVLLAVAMLYTSGGLKR